MNSVRANGAGHGIPPPENENPPPNIGGEGDL